MTCHVMSMAMRQQLQLLCARDLSGVRLIENGIFVAWLHLMVFFYQWHDLRIFSSCLYLANPVWYTFGEWNYYVDDTSTTHWEDARTVCQKNGGDLAIIRSAADNSFVTGLMKLQKTQREYGGWIGLFRKDDTKFYWVDGTPLQGHYSAWNDGEPSNSNGEENCTHILPNGKWNDLHCESNDDLSKAPVIVCQRPIRCRSKSNIFQVN